MHWVMWLLAATLLAQAFSIFQSLHLERQIMSSAQDAVDAVVARLGKAKDEIVAKIADVEAQLAAAGAADQVDLSALQAAAQALDDIVPDPAPEPPVE